MSFVFIYITNPTKREAVKVARHLLKKRMIACANIYSSDSLYWWEGKIASEREFVIIAKTLKEKFEAVRKEVEKVHPYTVPCIMQIPVRSNKKYATWLQREVRR